jgi:hypothetical protein
VVKKCFTEVKSGKAAREEKNDARWAVMMEKQEIKIKL